MTNSNPIKVVDPLTKQKVKTDKNTRSDVFSRHLEQEAEQIIHVPRDPEGFYADFGFLRHPEKRDPRTKLPALVKKLTPYQIQFWGHKGNIVLLKSNKIGLSTTSHLEMFQSRLLPEESGFDALLVAQNQRIANMHLLDLKKLVINSKKYGPFLIKRPDIELFKEEKSKLEQMYIRNPYNPSRPSRIIAIGGSVPSSFSWKHINRIHMSDVSQVTKVDESEFFSALYSRLANTNGVMKIESIPGAKIGEFYNIWRKANKIDVREDEQGMLVEDKMELRSSFFPMSVNILEALKYGVISQAYIDKAKRDLGEDEFNRLFMCQFSSDLSQWYKEEWEIEGDYGTKYIE